MLIIYKGQGPIPRNAKRGKKGGEGRGEERGKEEGRGEGRREKDECCFYEKLELKQNTKATEYLAAESESLYPAMDHTFLSDTNGRECRMRMNPVKEMNSCFYTLPQYGSRLWKSLIRAIIYHDEIVTRFSNANYSMYRPEIGVNCFKITFLVYSLF